MNSEVFREYDIRGVVARDFDDRFVTELGRAYATLAKEAGAKRLALGRDCRLSSERLRECFLSGLLTARVEVLDVGVVPTPLLYFAVRHWGLDGGVMITGSHNPAEYNGFKLMLGPSTLFGEGIQRLRRIIENRAFVRDDERGSVRAVPVVEDYRKFILGQFKLRRGMKVVVDGGNGCGGVVAEPLMRELGLDTIGLYLEMDGRFPNHHPDPTIEANMRELVRAVVENGAEVGIAFDGDADRIGAVDENGRIVWGDELLLVLARAILKSSPGAKIIGDVKCSQRIYDDIARRGGRPIMWKTGHSLLKQKLIEEQAPLAGEMSGHVFFADRYYGHDDAIYAAFRLLEVLSTEGKKLGELLADLPRAVVTPEIRVPCPDARKFAIVRAVAERMRSRYRVVELDGVRVMLEHGWGLLRASNTQPALVMRFESETQEGLEEIRNEFVSELRTLGVVEEGGSGAD